MERIDAEDGIDDDMDADEYRSQAEYYEQRKKYEHAIDICLEGLEKSPLNIDLIADIVKYKSKTNCTEAASMHYRHLCSFDFHRWTWRTFSYSLDFLMDTDPIGNEEECRRILDNYKKYMPYEERAWLAESKLEEALGNFERSMSVLAETLESHEHAGLCALRLADMQLKCGLYREVIRTANYGIAALANPQFAKDVPNLIFLRTLARNHLLCKEKAHREGGRCRYRRVLSSE